jgi:hypothetical protein
MNAITSSLAYCTPLMSTITPEAGCVDGGVSVAPGAGGVVASGAGLLVSMDVGVGDSPSVGAGPVGSDVSSGTVTVGVELGADEPLVGVGSAAVDGVDTAGDGFSGVTSVSSELVPAGFAVLLGRGVNIGGATVVVGRVSSRSITPAYSCTPQLLEPVTTKSAINRRTETAIIEERADLRGAGLFGRWFIQTLQSFDERERLTVEGFFQ